MEGGKLEITPRDHWKVVRALVRYSRSSFLLFIYQLSKITAVFSYSCSHPKYKKPLGKQATNSSSCYYWHRTKEKSTEMAACSKTAIHWPKQQWHAQRWQRTQYQEGRAAVFLLYKARKKTSAQIIVFSQIMNS